MGDIHGHWDSGDDRALTALQPDVALFVGDYGNENWQVTERISKLAERSKFGVATVFGNHDAFYTAHSYGRSRAPSTGSKVVTQQKHFEHTDVSYRSRSYCDWISIVGGRPFSWGGPHWKHGGFYKKYLRIASLRESTEAICGAVEATKATNSIIFLAHAGPTGLGNLANDPCGRDWGEVAGGDWGDVDLRAGITHARSSNRRVPLVVFGHMHRQLLNNGGNRKAIVIENDGDNSDDNKTIFLNAAVVPRHRLWNGMGTIRNFHIVTLNSTDGVEIVDEVWVTAYGEIVAKNRLFTGDNNEHDENNFGHNLLTEVYRDDAMELVC